MEHFRITRKIQGNSIIRQHVHFFNTINQLGLFLLFCPFFQRGTKLLTALKLLRFAFTLTLPSQSPHSHRAQPCQSGFPL